MKNKIISMLLIFSLLLQSESALAMDRTRTPSPAQSESTLLPEQQLSYFKNSNKIWPWFLNIFTAATCLTVGYLFGYKNGQKDHLDLLKEITFKGVAALQGGDVPSGRISPIPLAQKYIKDIFRDVIPKLSQDNEIQLSKLVAVEYYLRIIHGSGESEELSRDLQTLSKRMQGFIFNKSKITLGTLLDLLKDAQDLVDRAYKEIYVDKKQKEL